MTEGRTKRSSMLTMRNLERFPLPANVEVFVVTLQVIFSWNMTREANTNLGVVGRAPQSGVKSLTDQDTSRPGQDSHACVELGREILAKVSSIEDSIAIIARELYKHIENTRPGPLIVGWRKSLQWLKRLF